MSWRSCRCCRLPIRWTRARSCTWLGPFLPDFGFGFPLPRRTDRRWMDGWPCSTHEAVWTKICSRTLSCCHLPNPLTRTVGCRRPRLFFLDSGLGCDPLSLPGGRGWCWTRACLLLLLAGAGMGVDMNGSGSGQLISCHNDVGPVLLITIPSTAPSSVQTVQAAGRIGGHRLPRRT